MELHAPTTTELEAITGPQVIACVERELRVRFRVYPRWVASGKMKMEKARHELAAMTVLLELARLTYGPTEQKAEQLPLV